MEILMDFIKPELFILIPVMNIIGIALKSSSLVKNTLIPFYLGSISIILCAIDLFSSLSSFTLKVILACLFSSITQGILIAAVSVYAHQIYKLYLRSHSDNICEPNKKEDNSSDKDQK